MYWLILLLWFSFVIFGKIWKNGRLALARLGKNQDGSYGQIAIYTVNSHRKVKKMYSVIRPL